MRINSIYNCIVLFYLHAFCLMLCFRIEDIYSVELNMGASFLHFNMDYLELLLEMVWFSPFIMYYFFKKQEDTESNSFDKICGLIMSITLLLVVTSQLSSCIKKLLSFDLPVTPGILCIGVNLLALALYYLWLYNQQKFPTNENPKLVRICTVSCVLIQLIYSLVVTINYAPLSKLHLLRNDQSLSWCINRIQNLNSDKVNNIDDIIKEINEKKYKKDIKQFIEDKHLIYEKINDNKYKLSWKQYLTKEEKNKMNRCNVYIDNEFYNKNEEIVEIKKENNNVQKSTDNTNKKKIKLNKEEADAMKVLYHTLEKQNKQLLDQFDIENIENSESKDNYIKETKLVLTIDEFKALDKFLNTISESNREAFKQILAQSKVVYKPKDNR